MIITTLRVKRKETAMMVQGLWSIPVDRKINPDFDGGFIPVPVSDSAGSPVIRYYRGISYLSRIGKYENQRSCLVVHSKETAKLFAENAVFCLLSKMPLRQKAAVPYGMTWLCMLKRKCCAVRIFHMAYRL